VFTTLDIPVILDGKFTSDIILGLLFYFVIVIVMNSVGKAGKAIKDGSCEFQDGLGLSVVVLSLVVLRVGRGQSHSIVSR
jgi:hypothetical protein